MCVYEHTGTHTHTLKCNLRSPRKESFRLSTNSGKPNNRHLPSNASVGCRVCIFTMASMASRVGQGMLTLFMIISQGIDWGVAIEPLRAISAFAVAWPGPPRLPRLPLPKGMV